MIAKPGTGAILTIAGGAINGKFRQMDVNCISANFAFGSPYYLGFFEFNYLTFKVHLPGFDYFGRPEMIFKIKQGPHTDLVWWMGSIIQTK